VYIRLYVVNKEAVFFFSVAFSEISRVCVFTNSALGLYHMYEYESKQKNLPLEQFSVKVLMLSLFFFFFFGRYPLNSKEMDLRRK
jgi:hypothetical protein